jgi:nicotinamidase-related amidase
MENKGKQSLVVVHPWDMAPLSSAWNLRGEGHIDDVYERHIKKKIVPLFQEPYALKGIYLGLKEFRVHPSLNNLYDFVWHDVDMGGTVAILKSSGIGRLDVCGYCRSICVASFERRLSPYFSVNILEDCCLDVHK